MRAAPRTDRHERFSRIRLLPWVFGVETHVWIGMQNLGLWNPAFFQFVKPFPVHAVPLAAPPKGKPPHTHRLPVEGFERGHIAGDGVVVVVPQQSMPASFLNLP